MLKRFDEYKIGQREVVFFRKSNYVIEDFELLGYGGGDEYELPIFNDTRKYQRGYEELESYHFDYFLKAIYDYNKLVENSRGTSKAINALEQKTFIGKSNLHKLLFECRNSKQSKDFEIPQNGIILNLATKLSLRRL